MPIWKVLSHYGFYKVDVGVRIELEIAALEFSHVTANDWYSSGSSDEYVVYEPGTVTAQGYPAEKNAPVKR